MPFSITCTCEHACYTQMSYGRCILQHTCLREQMSALSLFPTTAPSFSVSVLPLLRLALALVLHGLSFLGGLASLSGLRHRHVHKRHRRLPRAHALVAPGLGHPKADGLADARRGGQGVIQSLGSRWSARGTSCMGGAAGLSTVSCLSTVSFFEPYSKSESVCVCSCTCLCVY